ncbi:MAG: hypothetical protein OEV44_10020, partial [Spirochaetota bacterium]|nr:hypothetical protein [Spirochaetota bacterium]
GSVTNSDPIYHFNLNLGWLRFFTKSNNIFYDRYLVNTGIPMVIELKPFDLTSFITSGSGYSIYVENNEWLRNLTLIFSNRVFSSTQFITSSMLWYGDFMANAVKIKTFFPSSNSETSESALEKLYPSTIDFGLGISDRIHVYQTSKMSIGIMFYFEAIVPKSREVAKNYLDLPPVGQFHVQRFTPSSTFTFATMGGVFFRYVKGYIDFYAQTTYQRRQGDFDAWTIGLKQNTVLSKVGVLLYEQFDFYFQHFLINWSLDLLSEESTINFFNVGSEIRGFGKKFYWIGLGFEGVYHIFHQDRAIYGGYIGKINGISLISSLNFYPLSLHSKDHRLKLSLIYGIFSFRQQGSGTPHPSFNINLDEKTSWNYALFFRVTYNI